MPLRLPTLIDLQTNGGWGTSFSGATLTADQVLNLAERYAGQGVGQFCPTLITADLDTLHHALETIAIAAQSNSWLNDRILGIHLEGPWISDADGYRGAHPAEHTRDPRWEDFQSLQDSAQGRIRIVTLAPERPNAIPFISQLCQSGVTVAIGHTAADIATINAAVDAGARLSTHLGNGIASVLPRHPNAIFRQAAEDRVFASFIADGAHLDLATLSVLTRAKGIDRTILVSDLSPLAGCAPGVYDRWQVLDDGRVVVAGTPYLAGASRSLFEGVATVVDHLGWSINDAWQTVTTNPARLLHTAAPNADDDHYLVVEQRPLRLIRSRIGGRDFTAS